jgi:hypothetical protein
MKNYKVTEETFIKLTSYANLLRNHYAYEMKKEISKELYDYYQKEIDEINSTFDEINIQHKTRF